VYSVRDIKKSGHHFKEAGLMVEVKHFRRKCGGGEYRVRGGLDMKRIIVVPKPRQKNSSGGLQIRSAGWEI